MTGLLLRLGWWRAVGGWWLALGSGKKNRIAIISKNYFWVYGLSVSAIEVDGQTLYNGLGCTVIFVTICHHLSTHVAVVLCPTRSTHKNKEDASFRFFCVTVVTDTCVLLRC